MTGQQIVTTVLGVLLSLVVLAFVHLFRSYSAQLQELRETEDNLVQHKKRASRAEELVTQMRREITSLRDQRRGALLVAAVAVSAPPKIAKKGKKQQERETVKDPPPPRVSALQVQRIREEDV